ncbi:MAG: hypothetical protein Q8Q81_03895 [Oxalobacteraceae bacterium]|nr:hypothetical protein [Oxalobacteraceae bacterium]
MALLATLCPGTALPALPPAAQAASAQRTETSPASAPGSADAAAESDNRQQTVWALPAARFAGRLSYDLRRDISEEKNRMQQGQTATFNASTNTFIWQPWFARVDGTLGLTLSRDSSDGNEAASSKSVVITGGGQLSVLTQSNFPFEAHFERNDSRVSSDLALANGYASQRYGFTQHYHRPEGDSMIGWDRSTQTSADTGRDRQDSLQLNLSRSLENHRVQMTGNRSYNTHEISGEHAEQNNLSLQHSYAPDPSVSVESMANISRSDYHLQQGDNDTRLVQLSSLAFWRPVDQAMTVTGGARVFALGTDTSGLAVNSNAIGARIRNANANFGVNYDLSRFTRINAGANVNLAENNGARSTNSNQSVGATYQPDAIERGSFRYNWSSSGIASNRTGGQDAGRQFTLQLSHNLSRSFRLKGGSSVVMDGSQSLAVVSGGSMSSSDAATTKQLTHSGSLSWDLSREAGTALARLSASDSRALDGRKEFFQLINFQASSNMPTGGFSSWAGNLTIQAVRQSANTIFGNTDPFNPQTNTASNRGFVSTSSGSLSYQNQRMFGVRRLRFVSDLRLNSQALLPLLGSAKDQETAAWENRFDYVIGLTQLRVNALISTSSARRSGFDSATGEGKMESVKRINKSIMFSLSRSFGNF